MYKRGLTCIRDIARYVTSTLKLMIDGNTYAQKDIVQNALFVDLIYPCIKAVNARNIALLNAEKREGN